MLLLCQEAELLRLFKSSLAPDEEPPPKFLGFDAVIRTAGQPTPQRPTEATESVERARTSLALPHSQHLPVPPPPPQLQPQSRSRDPSDHCQPAGGDVRDRTGRESRPARRRAATKRDHISVELELAGATAPLPRAHVAHTATSSQCASIASSERVATQTSTRNAVLPADSSSSPPVLPLPAGAPVDAAVAMSSFSSLLDGSRGWVGTFFAAVYSLVFEPSAHPRTASECYVVRVSLADDSCMITVLFSECW